MYQTWLLGLGSHKVTRATTVRDNMLYSNNNES
jgi:hypothetical protein